MGTAEIILSLIGLGRVALELVEKHQRGELSDAELQAAWDVMKVDLAPVSAFIKNYRVMA